MAPKEQKALFFLTDHRDWDVRTTAVPSPGAGEVLVRVDATALNPVDWKLPIYHKNVMTYPGILGTDGAGVVEEVGEGVTRFQKGDKILWQGKFENPRATFQQYALAAADLAAKIPDNVSVDEAASVPLTLATAYLALYNKKKPAGSQGGGAELMPFWQSNTAYAGQPFVVLGGATSVGQFVIQLARLMGFSPIVATASEKHADFLKSLGTTHVLPRTLAADALASEIAKITPHPIEFVYDTVSVADTQRTAWSLLAPGEQLLLVLPPDASAGVVPGKDGKDVQHVFGNVNYPGQQEAGRDMYARLTQLLRDGSIRPNRVQILPNGLAGIPDGLEQLRQDKVSGVKLVARPQETA
ncbi:GroES-like protein [Punctularia strigosozonata HHB-11173 SS5]|uniref:GroES-like protein n=1 Tax=Punctularia strigosozonata (strain HHB-11173) TaxID=741275 RepID=UPI0004416D39|nr:GroES-like protein [Punctularia strigosozonata HHB-11173 SS5]EIN12417.1 GroES-like protein [Punctularia strigosozonata HHB-11173 SS5]